MAFDYRTEYQRYKQYYTNLQRFYQKPITRVSVFVVISFMTVCFFSVFAIRPTLVTIGQLVKEIEDKQKLQQQLEQKLTDLARAQAEYSQVSEDLPLIWQAVPDTPDVSRLLLELELAAIQSQVSLVNLQVEPVTLVGQLTKSKDKGPAKMTFTVTAGGNFNQVKGFAENLEKLGRVIVVKEINFAKGTPFLQKEGISITGTITGEVYFIPVEGDGYAS